MVDSDNSTSLPAVTRRQVLTGAAGLTWPATGQTTSRQESGAGSGQKDGAVVAWHEWRKAHARTLRLCRSQQRLESQLMETVGFPSVTLTSGKRAGEFTAFSAEEIEAFFDDNSRSCQEAKAELSARLALWDARDAASGYSAALQAEAVAEQHEHAMAVRLFAKPASSLAGIQAKLDVMLRQAPCGIDDEEFPWPQLRTVYEDIAGLSAKG